MADTLVVASKIKAYIKSKAGMNTAASVSDALSDKVRQICDEAISNAQAAKRKTVRDTDIT